MNIPNKSKTLATVAEEAINEAIGDGWTSTEIAWRDSYEFQFAGLIYALTGRGYALRQNRDILNGRVQSISVWWE